MPSASSWAHLYLCCLLTSVEWQPSPWTIPRVHLRWYCTGQVDLVPWVSLLQFPSEWRILHGLLRSLLVVVAHPGAAHLQGYHLLLSVVNDPNVYSICSELLVLPIYWSIPIRLYLCCFIDWLWLDRWIKRGGGGVKCLSGPSHRWSRRTGPSGRHHVLQATWFV